MIMANVVMTLQLHLEHLYSHGLQSGPYGYMTIEHQLKYLLQRNHCPFGEQPI